MIHLPSHASDQKSTHASEAIWPNLKRVIAKSSGFKRWVVERGLDANATGKAQDNLVHSYLRQTLETLAY